MAADSPELRVAVDTGGTFTDVVAVQGARVAVAKVPSTPDNPARAVAQGMARVIEGLGARAAASLIHGTTVATNALLENRGERPWLVVNRGFEDLLLIGRQARPDLHALQPAPRPVLVPPERVVGVGGRVTATGAEVEPLDVEALDAVLAELPGAPCSWAVCLLHAYANPDHERRVAERIARVRPGDAISLSSEVLPVFREVERASTTVANAFVRPRMERYLGEVEMLAGAVEIMGSSGGRLPVSVARAQPVHTALSGPAGGVVGALGVARSHHPDGVLSFDMGGTSTDVALCRGELPVRHGSMIGDWAIHVPMLDIHTVGAGGGSIAWVDDGGALRVGPRSAGADPGPACYGRGELPTVTDANVVLGRLPADTLLGGDIPIDADRARRALSALAVRIGASVEETAIGVIRIAVETMAQAIRRISVERGEDPRRYPLCALGGAGALHACALADVLGCPSVLVPARAGLLSAVGMLQSAPIAERSLTVLGRPEAEIVRRAEELSRLCSRAAGTSEAQVGLELRYRGQSFELEVPFAGDPGEAAAAFAERHRVRFGYVLDAPVEPVTLRVRAEGEMPPVLPSAGSAGAEEVMGPRAVADLSATLWVAEGWRARPLADGTWHLERS
ncbi:MAG: hydantoinase/oxoprolinase family protein [Deltaproteobacteria bacterium]|nr:MAG: hydantoinase/oxoprolinase family protein [Deltaproteobacteria bacterium]